MSAPLDADRLITVKMWQDKCGELAAARAKLVRMNTEHYALRKALEESVKLQSHYAKLLNEHDGGLRLQFDSAEDWLNVINAGGAG